MILLQIFKIAFKFIRRNNVFAQLIRLDFMVHHNRDIDRLVVSQKNGVAPGLISGESEAHQKHKNNNAAYQIPVEFNNQAPAPPDEMIQVKLYGKKL
jgi:hypothetical protein